MSNLQNDWKNGRKERRGASLYKVWFLSHQCHLSPGEKHGLALTDTRCHWQPWATTTKDWSQLLVFVYPQQYKQPNWLSGWSSLAVNQTRHFITGLICPAAGLLIQSNLIHCLLQRTNKEKRQQQQREPNRYVGCYRLILARVTISDYCGQKNLW